MVKFCFWRSKDHRENMQSKKEKKRIKREKGEGDKNSRYFRNKEHNSAEIKWFYLGFVALF